MSKKQVIIFLVVMSVVTAFAIWKADCLQPYGSVIQAWVTVILVLLTAVYVFRIKQQSDASTSMAEEMREQRLGEARPYLLLRVTENYLQWNDVKGGESAPREFEVAIFNVGRGGPAMNLRVGLWSPNDDFLKDVRGYT